MKYITIRFMNISAYIFSGLFAITLISSFVIPVKLVKKILNCFIYPLMLGTTISILTIYLPDSFHNIFCTSISFGLLSISVALNNFKEYKKSFEIISSISLLFSFFPLINFFGTVFFLNHIPYYVVLLCILIYIAAGVSIAFFLKKQTPVTYIETYLTYIAAAFLNLLTFLALIYETRLYAPFVFAGSLLILLNLVFTALDSKVFKIKIGALISKIAQIAGYCLISTGLFFMIAM